jgi:sec-independent protein translocase protein TatC
MTEPSPVGRRTEAPSPAGQMTFLQHLDELRTRLLRALLAVGVAFAGSLAVARPVFRFLVAPVTEFLPEGERLAFTHLTDPFLLYMKVAFLTALFAASPFVLFELWRFVAPGLYARERRYAAPFVLFSSAFFIAGGLFGYYVVLPPACRFFIQTGVDWGFRPVLTVRELLSFESRILVGMGAVFEMPILTFFLARIGVLTHRFLIRHFQYAVLIIFTLAAVITPTPDMLTQTLFAAPMIVLYGISIGVAAVFGRREAA